MKALKCTTLGAIFCIQDCNVIGFWCSQCMFKGARKSMSQSISPTITSHKCSRQQYIWKRKMEQSHAEHGRQEEYLQQNGHCELSMDKLVIDLRQWWVLILDNTLQRTDGVGNATENTVVRQLTIRAMINQDSPRLRDYQEPTLCTQFT